MGGISVEVLLVTLVGVLEGLLVVVSINSSLVVGFHVEVLLGKEVGTIVGASVGMLLGREDVTILQIGIVILVQITSFQYPLGTICTQSSFAQ